MGVSKRRLLAWAVVLAMIISTLFPVASGAVGADVEFDVTASDYEIFSALPDCDDRRSDTLINRLSVTSIASHPVASGDLVEVEFTLDPPIVVSERLDEAQIFIILDPVGTSWFGGHPFNPGVLVLTGNNVDSPLVASGNAGQTPDGPTVTSQVSGDADTFLSDPSSPGVIESVFAAITIPSGGLIGNLSGVVEATAGISARSLECPDPDLSPLLYPFVPSPAVCDDRKVPSGHGAREIYTNSRETIVYVIGDNDPNEITVSAAAGGGLRVETDWGGPQEFPDAVKAYIWAGQGDDTVTVSAGANNKIDTGEGNDTVTGSDERDTIRTGDGDDVIHANGGNDNVDAAAGDDEINGGEGKDSLKGKEGNDTIRGDAGNDTVNGGSGDDNLTGGADKDKFIGGNGTDTCTDVAPGEKAKSCELP